MWSEMGLSLRSCEGVILDVPSLQSYLERTETQGEGVWDFGYEGMCTVVCAGIQHGIVNTASVFDVYQTLIGVVNDGVEDLNPINPNLRESLPSAPFLGAVSLKSTDLSSYEDNPIERKRASWNNKSVLYNSPVNKARNQTAYISSMLLLADKQPGFVFCDDIDVRSLSFFHRFIFIVLYQEGTLTQEYMRVKTLAYRNLVFVCTASLSMERSYPICTYYISTKSIISPTLMRLRPTFHASVLSERYLSDFRKRYSSIQYPRGEIYALPLHDNTDIDSLVIVCKRWKVKKYDIDVLLHFVRLMHTQRAKLLWKCELTEEPLNYDLFFHLGLLDHYGRHVLKVPWLRGGLNLMMMIPDKKEVLPNLSV